jgi:hypothetical protein
MTTSTSTLAQLALDSFMPQSWAEELQNSDRVTLDASEFSKLTFKVWDCYEDVEGEFQLRIQIQGVCDSSYNLLDKPEDLSNIKKTPGYFSVSGYVLEVAEDLPDVVVAALERFAAWTQEHLGEKNPEGRPSLFLKVSDDALVQFVIEPYTNTKGEEIFAFNGWAYRGLTWAGNGVGARPKTNRYVLTELNSVAPVPPVVLNRR